jgi:FAD/FMN-containing dehydrogenase
MHAASPPLLDRFEAIVGNENAIRDPVAMKPFLVEGRDLFPGLAAMVLRPGSVAEVSAILKLANETRTAIVPQGGNTGLVGGQTPDRSGSEVVVSLSRLNRVRAVDPEGYTMTVDAGVILTEAQAAAAGADRLFPLSLGAEGSCQIGGNLSTNAGGTGVLAYGNARDLALGLEVVLASGAVWNGLRRLRKDNTGYDLKNLFIGAEGTLGIITGAVLKLFPRPRGVSVALVGVPDPPSALRLLATARTLADRRLTAFELMPRICIDLVLNHIPGVRDPLSGKHAWYVLFEISSARSEADAEQTVEAVFSEGFDRNLIEDGVRAQSLEQAAALWKVRHSITEAQKREGGSIKHDISVPVANVPDLIDRGVAAVQAIVPGARPVTFGHLGDGNLHFNFSQPAGMDKTAFLSHWEAVSEAVYAVVGDLGGSISAEHGIGRLKRHLLPRVKSALEIDLMRAVKATLDPNGILNPGKVL